MDTLAASPLRLIPVPPLLAALVFALGSGLLRRSLSATATTIISLASTALSGAFVLGAFVALLRSGDDGRVVDRVGNWIGAGVGDSVMTADFAFAFDALTAIMAMLICGISLLTVVYASDYLQDDARDDRGYGRFAAYLCFTISMLLVLVLADNLPLILLGWVLSGMGASLLVGFWFGDEEHSRAAAFAFAAGRVGDLGLLLVTILVFVSLSDGGVPSLTLRGLDTALAVIERDIFSLPLWLGGTRISAASAIGLCLVIATCGRAFQGPLFAMVAPAVAAPTPACAILPGALLGGTAVYLLARFSFLFDAAPEAQATLATIGVATSLLASLVACTQRNLKKLIAYLAASQGGVMLLGVGAGAPIAAIHHVTSASIFMGTLFMAAGVVIVCSRGETGLESMGGLGHRFGLTRIFMFFGAASLVGCPPFAGLFSRDEVLIALSRAEDLPAGALLRGLSMGAVAATGFAATRAFILVFQGKARGRNALGRTAREPTSGGMIWSMGAMGIGCLVGLALGLSQHFGDEVALPASNSLYHFLMPVFGIDARQLSAQGDEWGVTGLALAASGAGVLAASLLYGILPLWPHEAAARLPRLRDAFDDGLIGERFYHRTLVRGATGLAHGLHRFIERFVIDGLTGRGSGALIHGFADRLLRHLQSGQTQLYYFVMVAGCLIVVVLMLEGAWPRE